MNDLIVAIMKNEELSNEQKLTLILKVANASHGIDRFVAPGFYLHTEEKSEGKDIDMQLWYRNIDENGATMHGPTNYDTNTILKIMEENCLDKSNHRKL